MKKILTAMALAALLAPLAAQATNSNGIGYTYVQLDYVNVTGSGHYAKADGALLSGSYQFADNFHVFGRYSDLRSPKYSSSDYAQGYTYGSTDTFKYRPWSLGMGYAASIGTQADWVTQVSYTHDRVSDHYCDWVSSSHDSDRSCGNVSTNGNLWAINTGVMGRVMNNLVANAYVGYSNGGHYSRGGPGILGNVYADFGMVYSFNPTWALHGGLRVNNDGTENISVGVRASF
jgi:opacity protein-like surface antigen